MNKPSIVFWSAEARYYYVEVKNLFWTIFEVIVSWSNRKTRWFVYCTRIFLSLFLTRTTAPPPNVRGARRRYVSSGRYSRGVYGVRLSKGNVCGNGHQMYFPLSGLLPDSDGCVPNKALMSRLFFSINDRSVNSLANTIRAHYPSVPSAHFVLFPDNSI